MRRRYGNFLGNLYHPDVVEVQSTDVARTQMSAMLSMAGLWPPAPEQRWHPSLDWQPVAIKSQPLDQDDVSNSRRGKVLGHASRVAGASCSIHLDGADVVAAAPGARPVRAVWRDAGGGDAVPAGGVAP